MAAAKGKSYKPKADSRKPTWEPGKRFGLSDDDGWVDALKEVWAGASPESRQRWMDLIELCRNARPRCSQDWIAAENEVESKCGYPPMNYPGEEAKPEPGSEAYQRTLGQAAPVENWLRTVQELVGAEKSGDFLPQLCRIVSRAVQSGIGTLNRNTPNKEILRGLIWCLAASPTSESIDTLRQLATWSVEHKTAQAKTIGIALSFLDVEPAAAALRMIAQAVKRPSPKTRFNRFASHVEEKIGLSSEDSSECFVPTFELDAHGIRRADCGDAGMIELRIVGSQSKAWFFNATGKPVGTPPAAMKRDHAELVGAFREAAKALTKLIATQRSRLESLLLTQTTWDFSTWSERYLNHPVVGSLASRLVWVVDNRGTVFRDGKALDAEQETVDCQPYSRRS